MGRYLVLIIILSLLSILLNWKFVDVVQYMGEDTQSRQQQLLVNLNRVNGIHPPRPPPNKTEQKIVIVGKRRHFDQEALYPKKTIVEDFATRAIAEEVKKHDRVLVQGMTFINSLTKNDLKRWIPTDQDKTLRKVCINIYTTSRDIPYIDAMMMSLMKGQSPKRLIQYAKINLMFMERHPQRAKDPHIASRIAPLPFLDFFNYSDTDPNLPGQLKLGHRQHFMFDTIRGLENCVHSALPWCLLMEEDALPPLGFIDKLEEFVIEKLAGRENQISVVSLYAYFNLKWSGPRRLSREYYSRMKYDRDRAKTNSERQAMDLPPYHANFTLIESNYSAGTVAMLYTQASAEKLLGYLKAQGYHPKQDADILINHPNHFPKLMNATRMQVEPSLVNHIGFYSSHSRNVDEKATLDQLNTDVRFMFDE